MEVQKYCSACTVLIRSPCKCSLGAGGCYKKLLCPAEPLQVFLDYLEVEVYSVAALQNAG